MREIREIEKLIALLEKLETRKSTNIKTETKQMTAPIPVKYYKYIQIPLWNHWTNKSYWIASLKCQNKKAHSHRILPIEY